jgi:pimeloyl-ACP methyl ester carboxylesterase
MFVKVGDAQIFTTAFGSPAAPTILGIGGWIGSWELWSQPFSLLSANWHTIAYDHRGSGATIAPIESISFNQLVDDIFSVLDAYQVASTVLAAESAGAATALAAALKHPQRIAGLIIVDGYYFGATSSEHDPFLAGLKSNYSATLDAFVQACVPEADCEPIKRWGRQILDRAAPEAAVALYRALNPIDLRSQVSGITQPTLILHGDADRLVPLEAARWLAQNLPHAQLVVLNGAGHVPTMTRPSEVAQEIARFLQPEALGSPTPHASRASALRAAD